MRLLCISDIHGRADALAAVLATAERRGYTQILVAGDLCYPGPAPLETWRRLTQAGAICVQGTGDRALCTLDLGAVRARTEHERARLDRLAQVRAELGALILTRIGRLPAMHRIPLDDGSELLLVHGSPSDPMEPLSHDMSDEEISALIGDDPADIVVCGGSHVPFDRVVSGVRIINVGSVGESPATTHADATLIEVRGGFADAEATAARAKAGGGTPVLDIVVEQLVVPLGKAA